MRATGREDDGLEAEVVLFLDACQGKQAVERDELDEMPALHLNCFVELYGCTA